LRGSDPIDSSLPATIELNRLMFMYGATIALPNSGCHLFDFRRTPGFQLMNFVESKRSFQNMNPIS